MASPSPHPIFDRVLIANRGEIAVRAIRTLRRLGITSIVVHSDPDRTTLPVELADVAVSLSGEKSVDTYLSIASVVEAGVSTGAQAVFPGYGFLSESVEFAAACEKAGIVFLGPTAEQISKFGLKHHARALAAAAGVPIMPGTELISTLEEALKEATRIRYPVMLKSTAGGGGIGLTCCFDAEQLTRAFESVKQLGERFFGDSRVFLERYVENARHVEVQIFGDGKGRVVAVGERDCSLQRRNQKVVEETPAPNLPAATRAALLSAATRLGESVKYRSAGTVEFVYDEKHDEFFFLEVNTRLQVEHPVTEMVKNVDLIEQMLRVGCGLEPDWTALSREPSGASIEVRIYAEDPHRHFQPSPGELTEVKFPVGSEITLAAAGGGRDAKVDGKGDTHPEQQRSVRLDGWVRTGDIVSSFYDPMLAKLIVHGANRAEAITRMRAALDESSINGVATNLDYLRAIIATPEFEKGKVYTQFLNSFDFHPAAIEVIEPGPQTTVQDFPGRVGFWDVGVPPSGPMDDYSFRLANSIVGNPSSAAGLECTLAGPVLRFHVGNVIAVTGPPGSCTIKLSSQHGPEEESQDVSMWAPVQVAAGQQIAVGKLTHGCRIYIAFRNGLDVPAYMGSRSTFLLGKFGGHQGRLLRAGDLLPIVRNSTAIASPSVPGPEVLSRIPDFPQHQQQEWRIGVVYGPHGAPDFFTQDSVDELLSSSWRVHHNSNRLGVRLTGPKPSWTRTSGGEAGLHPSNIHDCVYAIGSVNFTGDHPVILTCDGPSLGGFVCPFTVAQAELWKVGQVKSGDTIRFFPLSVEEAVQLQIAQNRSVETLAAIDVGAADIVRRATAAPSTSHSLASSSCIVARVEANEHHPEIVYRQAGDVYLLLEYGDMVLDIALRLRVYLLMEKLKQSEGQIDGIKQVSPGVRSVQIKFDPLVIPQAELIAKLLALEASLPDVDNLKIPSRVLHLPLAFEDSATLDAVQRYAETVRSSAPWLPSNTEFIRRINGLSSIDQVQHAVLNSSYMVLGLGDVYLGAPCAVALDPRHRLQTSKYNPARTFTAEGTVGIGGVYMCIYGMDSPGGYQLVGRTLPIWNKFVRNTKSFSANEPWLLRFFDQVRFFLVSEEKLIEMREQFRDGTLGVRVVEETFDYASYRSFLAEHKDDIEQFQARQKLAFDSEVELWKAHDDEAAANAKLHKGAHAFDDGDDDGEDSGDDSSSPEGSSSNTRVRVEISGSVWKICVQPGSAVRIGDTIMVVEAMKMELAVNAPVSGVLKSLNCALGSIVNFGDVVATIIPDEGASS